ncbi:MAG TPA: hypothetical protein HA349_11590 [Methanotrichaceae archaeon]|nr:hypothetical protein [Methanotrichaceae archaeon]
MSEGPIFDIGSQQAGIDIIQGRDINKAGRDINKAAGDLIISTNSTAEEVLKVIHAIKYKIKGSDIELKNKREINKHLDNAIFELKKENPDKVSITDSIKQTNEILKEAKTTGETLTYIGALLGKVAIWLGSYVH